MYGSNIYLLFLCLPGNQIKTLGDIFVLIYKICDGLESGPFFLTILINFLNYNRKFSLGLNTGYKQYI